MRKWQLFGTVTLLSASASMRQRGEWRLSQGLAALMEQQRLAECIDQRERHQHSSNVGKNTNMSD